MEAEESGLVAVSCKLYEGILSQQNCIYLSNDPLHQGPGCLSERDNVNGL